MIESKELLRNQQLTHNAKDNVCAMFTAGSLLPHSTSRPDKIIPLNDISFPLLSIITHPISILLHICKGYSSITNTGTGTGR